MVNHFQYAQIYAANMQWNSGERIYLHIKATKRRLNDIICILDALY